MNYYWITAERWHWTQAETDATRSDVLFTNVEAISADGGKGMSPAALDKARRKFDSNIRRGWDIDSKQQMTPGEVARRIREQKGI